MKKKMITMLTGIMLLFMLPVGAFAKGEGKERVVYSSLGDSLAAGQTPYRTMDKGYADYLTERFQQSNYPISLEKHGVSGYTSEQLKQQVLLDQSVQNSIGNATLVTVNVGANDVLGQLKKDPSKAGESVMTAGKNLAIVLGAIDEMNPDADVYVMGYYNPFPYLPESEQEKLMPLLEALNTMLEHVSERNGDTFVETEKMIEKRETRYIPNPEDIHLSPEGYQAVAKEFWKAIDDNR